MGKLLYMDPNADLALQNAWNSVLASAEELRATPLDPSNLEAIQPKVLAQANAAQALRGLIEELRRKAEKDE